MGIIIELNLIEKKNFNAKYVRDSWKCVRIKCAGSKNTFWVF